MDKVIGTNVADLLITKKYCEHFSFNSYVFISQAAKEKKFLKLCYDGTADIKEFSSLLQQGVDPNVYDEVGAGA